MKKGFTLIELLAVIVILAVISLITTPIILGIIEDTKKQAFEVEAKNIEQAAEYYLLQGLKINEVPDYEEYYIPVSEFTDYIQNVKDEMLDESVIVKKTSNSISYYYTGRDSNPYISNTTLKQAVESDTTHISSNIKVNGVTVNKVIGVRTDKRNIKNWVWYSGQLWQVLETHSDYIKMITANSVSSIPYGTNNTWSTSWMRKWLNEIDSNSNQDGIFYNSLSRNDLLLAGRFCLDEPTGLTESSGVITAFTPVNTCSNISTDKVGLMTFEDYVYSLNGVGISGVSGGSFIDELEVSWTMTKYTVGSVTNRMWHTYHQDPVHFSHTYTTTNDKGLGVRPVIYLNSNAKIENDENSNYGTIYNPYQIVGEQVVSANNNLSGAAIGSYLYLNESNSPYTTTNEIVTSRLSYTYDKTKVRYRVVGINGDGSVKVERAALLKGLQSPVAINEDLYMAYYYKSGTCDYDAGVNTDCINHNYFKPNEGTGSYAYSDSENLAYYLNNATNSFYSWFSAGVKENIVLGNWNLPTMANGVDYTTVLFNTTTTGTYPTRSNDGLVSAYIGLPQWGSMFSGNDLGESYWYINRISNSNYNVGYQSNGGYTSNNYAADTWRGVRPVLNLKSNVRVVSGEGTPASPYVLNIQ